ncbi:MAG: phosphate acyltransferase [Pseudomonadota bacterium]
MDVLLELREKARRLQKRIVLPESQDRRVLQAAALAVSEGLCRPALIRTRGMAEAPALRSVYPPVA